MEFVLIESYYNYLEAAIVKEMLEVNDILCWLKDETIGTLRLYSSGGIKLMVREDQVQQALDLMKQKSNNN